MDIRNLAIHRPVYMILTVSRFLIICLTLYSVLQNVQKQHRNQARLQKVRDK